MSLKLEKIYYLKDNFKLENINFEFKNSGVYLISGPSGCGKSTLLKIIGGFLKISSGKILYNSKNLYSLNKKEFLNYKQKIISISYQNLNLIEEFSVKENLLLKAKLIGEKIDNSWLDYLLDFFEIKNLVNKKVSEISGGQALRVNIVKSVLLKPKILLLDEPESWLDSKLTKKLINFEKQYSKENLVIISSHFFGIKSDNLNIEKIKL